MALVQDGANPSALEQPVQRMREISQSEAWSGRFGCQTLAFHLTCLAFLVAAQAPMIDTREMSADNTWHFRLARDILSGREIYWAGVDANRFFPDLLFSMAAVVLPFGRNRIILGGFTALSALAALSFTLIKTDDTGGWHYRYLAVSTAFALVMLCVLPFWSERTPLPRRNSFITAVVSLSALLIFTLMTAQPRRVPASNTEAGFKKYVAELAQMIGRHSKASKLRGYAEYWLASAVSTQSDVLQLALLDSVKPEARFYNNNAADVCADDHFFIALSSERDEPKRAELLSAMGEPNSIERITMPRFGEVSVLYYDPATIRDRITLPGRQKARGLFPAFNCPS